MRRAATWCLDSCRVVHEIADNRIGGFANIAHPRALVRRGLFENRELALEQRGGHEMPAAVDHALREQCWAAGEIHKPHVRIALGSQQVAIASLQRRTRDDETNACTLCGAESGSDRTQPAVAVGVRQWYSGRHAIHIFRRVEVITFHEFDAEHARELRSDRALSGASDAHDHVEPTVRSAHEVGRGESAHDLSGGLDRVNSRDTLAGLPVVLGGLFSRATGERGAPELPGRTEPVAGPHYRLLIVVVRAALVRRDEARAELRAGIAHL